MQAVAISCMHVHADQLVLITDYQYLYIINAGLPQHAVDAWQHEYSNHRVDSHL